MAGVFPFLEGVVIAFGREICYNIFIEGCLRVPYKKEFAMSSKKTMEKRLLDLLGRKPAINRPGSLTSQLLNEMNMPKTDSMFDLVEEALNSLERRGAVSVERRGKQLIAVRAKAQAKARPKPTSRPEAKPVRKEEPAVAKPLPQPPKSEELDPIAMTAALVAKLDEVTKQLKEVSEERDHLKGRSIFTSEQRRRIEAFLAE